MGGLLVGVLIVWFGIGLLLGHRFYFVEGTARIERQSLDGTAFPVIVCAGHGGPLERSGVMAHPLGLEAEEPHVLVLCHSPDHALQFPFRTGVYTNAKPRSMHAYVWLEAHEELAGACSAQSPGTNLDEFLKVPPNSLSGYGAELPTLWPCRKPRPGAVLGYAVAFEQWFSSDEQSANVELRPSGYPSSRVVAQ